MTQEAWDLSDLDPWKAWTCTRETPYHATKKDARVKVRDDGTKWITFRDFRKGKKVIVQMPENALTKTCDRGTHPECGHNVGGPYEGGILLRFNFLWRCGCPCHSNPHQIGLLF